MKGNSHIGSDFDESLPEEGILAEVQAVAVKRVLDHQLEQCMKAKQLTKWLDTAPRVVRRRRGDQTFGAGAGRLPSARSPHSDLLPVAERQGKKP